MKQLLTILTLLLMVGCGREAEPVAKPQLTTFASDTLSVRGRFLQDTILLGDRFDYLVEVEKDVAELIEFPELTSEDLELVAEKVDTLRLENRRQVVSKRYTFVAFGLGDLKLLPQVLYGDKNVIDTLCAADSVALHIGNPFVMDSTFTFVEELQPQANMPFIFAEIKGYVKWAVIFLVVALLVLYIAYRILRHYGLSWRDLMGKPLPLPPHIVAKQALEHLLIQRLWQAEKHKQYYSALTDILREYISSRWGVGAMEMTSDEVVEALRELDLQQKSVMDLRDMLQQADLVKFAKAMPEAADNEQAYSVVWDFVEQTTPVEQSEEEKTTNQKGE